MALFSCPECERQISDDAEACPNCGVVLSQQLIEKSKKEAEAKQKEEILCGVGLFAFLFALIVLIVVTSGPRERSTSYRSPSPTKVKTTNAPTQTMLGNWSSDKEKHVEDARTYLLRDGRAAVRKGKMTRQQFEAYTGVKY